MYSPFQSWYEKWGKRFFDVAMSLAGLIVLGPLLLVLYSAVRGLLGRPALFRQSRPGFRGKTFTILKLRTMTTQAGPDGSPLPDAVRLTRLGRFLRATSLDELPELLNVLKGDMSLVGPRPLLERYYPYFRPEELVRFEVRPGITGLAQVHGRNDLSWDRRIAMDVEYARGLSFRLDLKILLLTAVRVLRRDGLRVDPGASMLDLDEERRQLGIGPESQGNR